MGKVINYIIITDYAFRISDKVNDHLERGWELFGTPFGTNQNLIAQAMVKYEDDDALLPDDGPW